MININMLVLKIILKTKNIRDYNFRYENDNSKF